MIIVHKRSLLHSINELSNSARLAFSAYFAEVIRRVDKYLQWNISVEVSPSHRFWHWKLEIALNPTRSTALQNIFLILFFLFQFLAKIGFFYSVFYGVLAALVAVCMLVFLRTLDPRIPKWQLHESLIGTNPGTEFALKIFAVLVNAKYDHGWNQQASAVDPKILDFVLWQRDEKF